MAPLMTTTRVARFFRLAAVSDGAPYPLPRVPWPELVQKFGRRTPVKRVFSHGGRDYRVAVSGIGDRHLVFFKNRLPSEPLTQVEDATGDYTEVPASSGGRTFADNAAVIFVGTVPIFGIVTSSAGSPRAQAVAHWLTWLHPFKPDLAFVAEPLISQPDLQKLSGAFGVKKIHLRVPFSRMSLSDSSVGQNLAAIAGQFSDGVIDVAIGTGRANPSKDFAQAMLDLAEDAANNLGEGATAEASVVHEVASTAKSRKGKMILQTDVVDLIQHEFATPFQITVRDDRAMIDASLHRLDATIAEQHGSLIQAWEAVADEPAPESS